MVPAHWFVKVGCFVHGLSMGEALSIGVSVATLLGVALNTYMQMNTRLAVAELKNWILSNFQRLPDKDRLT